MARLGAFLAKWPWPRLQPDLENKLVTSGRGEGAQFIAAACTPEGALGLLYVPADGQSSREITLDLSRFPGAVTAHWFNPAKDAALTRHDAVLPNRGRQTLHTPGDNGTGVNDWVLVLEAER
jgi:hypothetical protein